ncbi:vacuolar protein sorting protein [Rhodotorula toruloides]|uniref:Vacuolar protein sorting-associated protein 29 n=1 Tax=Rhodotorula toruloides TaxID=5286 RepID=A0A511KJE0_RHOTO|nr:vacuolar protein sorting protein [Rhodotorula toruloides]
MLVLVIGDLHIPNRAHDLPAKFKKLLVPGKIGQILSTGNTTDQETWDYLRSVAPDVRGVRGDWDEPSASLPPSMVVQHGPLRIGVIHGHQVVPLGDAEMLAATARKMDVDVLVSGGTHRFEAFESDGRFFLNPGSATGAFSPLWTPASTTTVASDGDAADKTGEGGEGAGEKKADDAADGEQKDAEQGAEGAKGGKGGKGDEQVQEPEGGPTPSFALLDIQGNVVVTYVYTERHGDVSVEKMEFRKST